MSIALARDPRFHRGVDRFNAEEFFEAHEAWEALWHEAQGPEREFVQGMIQVASAMHHLQIGNMRGARILYGSGVELLSAYGDRFGGLDLDRLRRDFRSALTELLDRPLESLAGRSAPHLYKIPYSTDRAFKIEIAP